MPSFVIDGLAGERRLRGTIAVGGMKNAVLPIMAASTAVAGTTELTNVPDIADVRSMATMIESLGAEVLRGSRRMSLNTGALHGTDLMSDLAKSMRASVLLTGPILARMGRVTFPHPGGCVLGSRPIDVFVTGFEALGATYSEAGESYTLSAPDGLRGGEIFFRVVSVTATETFMIAATLAKGPVTLMNCAMEPEVVATANYLVACGAQIAGIGTPTVVIQPSTLRPPAWMHQIPPDRIEAGSFMVLGALAGEEVVVQDIEPADLRSPIDTLRAMGVPLEVGASSVTVRAPSSLNPVQVRTHEHPGFPTDLQAPLGILLTQAAGESSILETIFDGRLNYTADLVRMGANIQLWNPHKATFHGKTPLKARPIDGPDIRAGLAFVLAGIIAEGTTRVGNAHLVDRGYEKIEERLSALGVSIRREA